MSEDQVEKIIRVGSRKSELALIQTKYVIGRLQKLYPNKKFEIHTMSTIGDRVLNISLPKIGEKSLFTRDLEDALRNGGVDFVVHSLKDLPTALPVGMAVGAVLERDDARDALVLRENYRGLTIATLPKGSVLGTSSLRRTAQIRRQYPHLVVCDIRGNLNTRLAKLDAPDSKFAGIILAQAGLVRMGWMNRISQVLEPTDLLYAVGQGALAVECRAHDNVILKMLQKLMCLPTTCRILAERSFLKTLGGGCSAPVAVWSNLNGKLTAQQSTTDVGLTLTGAVWSLDGAIEIRDKLACTLKEQPLKRARQAEIGNDENGNGTDSGVGNGDGSGSNDSPPPTKRQRYGENDSNSNSPTQRHSPPVINDDADVEQLSATFNVEELIERHIDLVKQCPVIGAGDVTHIANGNCTASNGNGGGGDADSDANINPKEDITHCPLPINVGQDVMGQCPFVDNETKVNYASAGKLHIASHPTVVGDETDNATPTTSSKCPFAALHNRKGMEFGNTKTTTTTLRSSSDSGTKCPFLQKTVQMFDYSDEEKPLPQKLDVLIADVDNLFCGLYQHACYSRELYERSNKLGKQLADELIKKGALDVMKVAQTEIHSKAT